MRKSSGDEDSDAMSAGRESRRAAAHIYSWGTKNELVIHAYPTAFPPCRASVPTEILQSCIRGVHVF
eukprot:2005764-Pleurochrysis_carterae.AAC.2